MRAPIIALSNGLRVGNFCSGHAFTFADGSVLPACPRERVEESKLVPVEGKHPSPGGWVDVTLEWRLTSRLIEMLVDATDAWRVGDVDLFLVPFPLLAAMKSHEGDEWLLDFQQRPRSYPFRVIRRDGREGDGGGEGRVCIDRFCV